MIIIFDKKYTNQIIMISALIVLIAASIYSHATLNRGREVTILISEIPATTEETTTTISVNETFTTTYENSTETEETTVEVKSTSEKSTKQTKASTEITSALTLITETEVVEELYIDINTANHDELVKLNGIGDYLAEQIILYREENGGFKNIEELVEVSGIGEAIFNSISGNVYVENPVYYEEVFVEDAHIPDEDFPEETTEEITEYIPTIDDYAPVNLNEADMEILMLMPCIDSNIAEKILDMREKLGGFSSTYELLFVDGLTNEMYIEIVKYFYVPES